MQLLREETLREAIEPAEEAEDKLNGSETTEAHEMVVQREEPECAEPEAPRPSLPPRATCAHCNSSSGELMFTRRAAFLQKPQEPAFAARLPVQDAIAQEVTSNLAGLPEVTATTEKSSWLCWMPAASMG